MSNIVDGDEAPQGAVARALQVLDYIAQADLPTRLSDCAAALGMQKSTVHRILRSLAIAGYVDQVQGSSAYVATLKLWEIGSHTLHSHPVVRAATDSLQELHRETGETVSVSILLGDDVLYLDKILAPRKPEFLTRVGSRVPAPFAAGGKAMLAHLRDARARVERVAAQVKGSHCIQVDALMCELAEVRERGYAASHYAIGVMSVAAPLMARGRRPVGALTVSAPTDRATNEARTRILERLLQATARASQQVVL
jgi:IclR family acetate operon transcriptional repressor